MNSNSFDQFISLVATVRHHQNLFWNNGRSKSELAQSLALEDRLDKYLDSCKSTLQRYPNYSPEPTAKAFFDLVDNWRTKFKAYFRYKKHREADPTVCQEMRKECQAYERQIDELIKVIQKI